MHIRNQNHRPLLIDQHLRLAVPRDERKRTPVLETEHRIGIGYEAVSLEVGGAADEEPAEHGVAAVPFLGVDGGAPSPFGEAWEVLCEFVHPNFKHVGSTLDVEDGEGCWAVGGGEREVGSESLDKLFSTVFRSLLGRF